MIYLPTNLLEPGMVLGRDVPSSNPVLPLLMTGQTLTQSAIRKVAVRGIKGLYIEFAASDDLQCQELLAPEQKNAMLAEIKTEFVKVEKRNAMPNIQVVSRMAEDLVLNILGSERLLSNVMDIRDYDNYTYSHSLYVSIAAVVLGANMDLPPKQLTELATAGILHDIGKLGIPERIINKSGALTPEEYELVKEHPLRALPRLRRLPDCKERIIQGVITHHEFFDGSGYPNQLTGARIPLFGRLLAVADVYDALSSNRSYRQAWSPAQVMDYIESRSGTQFDPGIVAAFHSSVTAYPVGTPVKLSDGSIGLVIQNHRNLPLRPTVRILSPATLYGREVDLSAEALHVVVEHVITDRKDLPQVPSTGAG